MNQELARRQQVILAICGERGETGARLSLFHLLLFRISPRLLLETRGERVRNANMESFNY